MILSDNYIYRMLTSYKCFIPLFLLVNTTLYSQLTLENESKVATTIATNLVTEGFQSIDISKYEQGLVIAYEDRVYRFSAFGLRRVIDITNATLAKQNHTFKEITYITKRHNIPEVSSTWKIENSDTKALSNIQFTRKITASKNEVKLLSNQNTGNFRAELILRPYLSMELGNLYLKDQFIHLIDLRPKLNIYLWKGAHFTYEFILPISNEFKGLGAPHWSEIRPRVVSLTQRVRLPYSTFINTSIGFFSRNRYGISTQIGKYFLKDRLWVTGKFGYTGHASYVRFNGGEMEKGWAYTTPYYVDYKVGIHYWLPKWNTQVSVEYGKVLSDRTAVFVKCQQKFKEVDIGFFIYRTDEGSNYGMEIGIPIFPKKYWKPRLFSIRPATHFRYNYLSGFDRSGQVNLAREYQAQGMYGNFPQDLNPHFLKNYVLGN